MKAKLKMIFAMARKQAAILICATIIIVSLVFSWWPTQGWYTDLGAKVDKSVSSGSQINTILTHVRHMPNVTSDPIAVAPVLPTFPTQDVYQQGQTAVKTLGDHSQQLLDLAIQINTHFPLDPQALLPNSDDISRGRFASSFLAAVDGDTYIRNWPPDVLRQANQNFTIPPLAAGQAPSQDEIQAAMAGVKAQFEHDYPNAGGANAPQLQDRLNQLSADKITELTLQHATCKVYLQPGAIKRPAIYDTFKNATNSLPAANVWTAQLWLWIAEDAATAVARANQDAKSVSDSPVKQILDLTIKDPPYLVAGDPTAGSDVAPLTPAPDVSPTGRVCNGMYDVTQFSMSLDVDADKLAQVLDALQSNQFLTILSVTTTAVDSAARAAGHFVYGGARIVHLDLVFEDLFLHTTKDGYSQYCPTGSGPQPAGAPGAGVMSPNMLQIITHGG